MMRVYFGILALHVSSIRSAGHDSLEPCPLWNVRKVIALLVDTAHMASVP